MASRSASARTAITVPTSSSTAPARQPSLSDVLPSLTNMGVVVDDEHPYDISRAGSNRVGSSTSGCASPSMPSEPARPDDLFEEAFLAVLSGTAEDDGFNRLVLVAGLSWREVSLLRAYSRYLRQTRHAVQPDVHRGRARGRTPTSRAGSSSCSSRASIPG